MRVTGVVGLWALLLSACTFDTSGLRPRADRGDASAQPEASADLRDGPVAWPDGRFPDLVPSGDTPGDRPRPDLPPPPCLGTPSLCQGKTPICDGVCRGCRAHSECPAGLCRSDGSCPAASEISFVDDDCGSSQDGSSKSPYCKIGDAVGKTPPYILVRAGTYGDLTVNANKEIYGEAGAIIDPSACDKIVLDGKFEVLLAGFKLKGNVLFKGGVRGTLLRNEIGPSECVGVNGVDGEVRLERNLVFGHTAGGVFLDGKYRVVNNIIVKNGKGELTWGAVKIVANDPSSLFINNTVANNEAKGSNAKEAGGVRCEAGAATATFVNTIFWGNTFSDTGDPTKDRQYGPGCTASFSLEQLKSGATPGSNNLSLHPLWLATGLDTSAYYYRLQAGSPAKNKGTAANAPAVDYDGEPRDAIPDIGADELFP